MSDPALGLIELASIAYGLRVVDAMVKQSPVQVLDARAVSPGKFLVLVGGDVAEVEAAMQAGLDVADPFLVDSLFLPYAHESLMPVIKGKQPVAELDSLAVVETLTIASCLLAADVAVKTAPVQLIEMRLANQLGGKGFFTFTGDLADVEAAAEAAVEQAASNLFSHVVIPRPHADIHGVVL